MRGLGGQGLEFRCNEAAYVADACKFVQKLDALGVCLWQRIFDSDTCRCSCTSCPTGTRRVDREHGVTQVNLLEHHVVLGERA